ncbi:MAG: HAD family hydrolase [Chthoniobacterales bacterium]
MFPFSLFSTDFDGTLFGFSNQNKCSQSMQKLLQTYADQQGIWVVNTGRSFQHTLEGLADYQASILPHFLIVNERHIFELCGKEYKPWNSWNTPCDEHHLALWQSCESLIAELKNFASENNGVTFIDFEGNPEGIVADDMTSLENFIIFFDRKRKNFPDFSYERNSIYLRFSHIKYNKGKALQHLQKSLNIGPDSTAVAGDNMNDLSMLRKDVAEFLLCPENAVHEVKMRVQKLGGQIGDYPAEEGIINALEKLIHPQSSYIMTTSYP